MESTDSREAVSYQRLATLIEESKKKIIGDLKKITGDLRSLVAKIDQLVSEKAQREDEIQRVMEELESEKAQKEAQVQKSIKLEAVVQKVMEENLRLGAMLDKKEAQLQAMSEQCKFLALNHHN